MIPESFSLEFFAELEKKPEFEKVFQKFYFMKDNFLQDHVYCYASF